MADPRGGTLQEKTKIIKQLTKVTKNMEKTETNLQNASFKILEDIYRAKENKVSDSEQVGLVRAVVSRTIEKVRTSQKNLD